MNATTVIKPDVYMNEFATFLKNAPHTTKTKGIMVAKELFGENIPYIEEERIEGSVIIFNAHFTKAVVEALSTGCVAKMNNTEKKIFKEFLTWTTSVEKAGYSQKKKLIFNALDQWLYEEVQCKHHEILNKCFDQKFDYTNCYLRK